MALPSEPAAAGALDDARVYVPVQSGELIALDRETGDVAWSIDLQSAWPPVAEEGVVYLPGTNALHAVQASTGDRLWAVAVEGALRAPLALQGEILLALVEPGEMLALRASDGLEIWRRQLAVPAGAAAMATDETSVCVSIGGRLLHLALADGSLRWQRDVPGTLSPPSLAGDRVFVGSTDNNFYAFHADTGRLAWRWRSGGDVVGAASDDRLVYIASLDHLLRAVRRGNGNQVWKRELKTRTLAPPSAFGGVVLLTGNDPTLSTFDAETGAPIASYSAPSSRLQGAPLVDPALRPFRVAMIAVTRDGRAIGLRPVGMMFRERAPVPLETLPGRPLTREPFSTPAYQTPDSVPAAGADGERPAQAR